MGIPKITNALAEKIVKDATGKSFSQIQSEASNDLQKGLAVNEYLPSIKNQIGKIITGNYLKTENPIMKYFWKGDDTPLGDYKMIRQTMLATRDIYSDKLDVNEHYNVNVKENVFWTVFKDKYAVSLSADIVKGAFNGISDMATFIAHYWGSVQHSINITWLDRNRALMETHPLVYRLQSSTTDGVAMAKEIWNLLQTMGMVTNKFNLEGIPSATSSTELIMVLSNKIQQEIQFGAVGGMFNFSGISNSGTIGGMSSYNFSDNKTLGFIGSEYSYWLDFRLNENTSQEWASTLIKDTFHHQWIRAGRIGFANGVRIVAKDFKEDHIDYQKSPLSHINNEGVLVKDDAKIVDITDFVLGGVIKYDEYVPIAVKNLLVKGITVKGVGDVPTADELNKAFKSANFKLDTTKLNWSSIKESSALLSVEEPYVLGAGRDKIVIHYNYSKTSAVKTEPKSDVKVEEPKSDVKVEEPKSGKK